MKKSTLVLGAIMLISLQSPLVCAVKADLAKGQKIFKKKFRKKCRFSGVRFARHHTQAEWEEIWEEGRFPQEAKKICPRLDIQKIKPKWWKPIYEFSKEYAKDGRVPKC